MAGLNFGSDYALAEFIIRFLVLPVIIGCGLASCLLRSWKGADRSLRVTYNLAVVTFLISVVFYIAYEGRIAAAPLRASRNELANYFRPLIIFDVFVLAFDLISKIAIFAAVTQVALVLTSSSGRRSFLHLFRIAIVAILILLLILNIAFYGRYSDLSLHPLSAYGRLDNYNWLLRSFGTGAAFYVIYLLAMIAVTIISIFSRSSPAVAASIQLVMLAILALASNSGFVDYLTNLIKTVNNGRYSGRDYNTFESFAAVAIILEVILQTGALVALFFGTESRQDGHQTTRPKNEVTNA